MKSENRYLFQGHAVAASAQFRRFKDQPIKVDNCLKNVSAAIPADATLEGAVEPARETFFVGLIDLLRLEKRRAERRGEDQRHQHRQHHR